MADTKLSALTELAATPADDDEVYIRDVSEAAADESKRVRKDRIARSFGAGWTADKFLKGAGVGSDPTEVDTPASTKELSVPAQLVAGTFGTAGVLVDGGTDAATMKMLIPQDFTSITALEIIFRPRETGASMNFVVMTFYGAYNGGEDWNVHTETVDPRDIGATVTDRYLAHSISDLVDVSALAAGDLLAVYVQYDAAAVDSNSDVQTLRLKYT